MRKIHVTGNAGSGKTTMGKAISQKLNINFYALDSIVWKPGWIKTPAKEVREKIDQLIQAEEWVIEGVSSKVFQSAEVIIFLDIPLWRCLINILRRSLHSLTTSRPELPPHCPEYIGMFKAIRVSFLYQRVTRPQLLKLASDLKGNTEIYYVKNRKESLKILESFPMKARN